ncbi:Bis(5'-adenosyl)-triphosphatase enpp4 [Camellia lanceoleosa]|uniref:Bis(5'-adenosyl)-triphosphatase enpp4 n=1 Tax=Camellia lanceoleosa TaxID=1840588 RepID=A0ACC0G699_9ERIC|nr:Bis(5'-adenosyl)-triphosphatase enpp4 [Camellia lanceoleosa]
MQFQLMKKTHQTQPRLFSPSTQTTLHLLLQNPPPPPSSSSPSSSSLHRFLRLLFFSSSSSTPQPHNSSFTPSLTTLAPIKPPNPSPNFARPLTKLTHPVVLLVSSDGFRLVPIQDPNPNIDRLIDNGTEAERGLIYVFPTLTFPNHYSIVTGLYRFHGIINNHFVDPYTVRASIWGVMNPSGGWVNPCGERG